MKHDLMLSAATAAFVSASAASATSFATLDFDSGRPIELSGSGSLETVGVLGGNNGFGGSFLRNTSMGSASEFTFTGLGAHSDVTVSFGLAMIDSWDGATGGGAARDFFNMLVDGHEVLEVSTIYSGRWGGTERIPSGVTGRTDIAGFSNGTWGESLFDVSVTFAHTSSILQLAFFADGAGWQGRNDESWGIDNLTVSYSAAPVPLPAGAALLLTGLAAFGLARRRAK